VYHLKKVKKMLIQNSRVPITDIILYGLLPGFLKVFVYRLKGYKIGKNVTIGWGSVICGDAVDVGDFTKIGFFTIIRGKNIKIGSHVSIGSTTFIDTPIIAIGHECKINEQVFVGGLQYHNSSFIVGNNCQIMQMSYINPAISITLGNDSVIGGHCLIFGHNSWLNIFEGYDVKFEPIEIGNDVALSWRVFVLPGTKIGDGSVIAPESLVNRSIPSKCLAAGNPVKIISKDPEFPRIINEEKKNELLRNIINDMIQYFSGSGLHIVKKDNFLTISQDKKALFSKKKQIWLLQIIYDHESVNFYNNLQKNISVLVSLKTITNETRKVLNQNKIMWLDIEKKERPFFWNDLGDEVALFLRRYGVRFNRVKE